MQKGMFAKKVANSLVSLLGVPLHEELINAVGYGNALQVCFQIDSNFNFSQTIKAVIKEV